MLLKKLRILTYNVNSLYSLEKRTAFNMFMKNNNPDIALISETKVTKRNNINVVGYKTFRQDKREDRRGTAIFVRDQISYSTSQFIIPGLRTSEATAVKIDMRQEDTLTLISIYFKCRSSIENIQNDMRRLQRSAPSVAGHIHQYRRQSYR